VNANREFLDGQQGSSAPEQGIRPAHGHGDRPINHPWITCFPAFSPVPDTARLRRTEDFRRPISPLSYSGQASPLDRNTRKTRGKQAPNKSQTRGDQAVIRVPNRAYWNPVERRHGGGCVLPRRVSVSTLLRKVAACHGPASALLRPERRRSAIRQTKTVPPTTAAVCLTDTLFLTTPRPRATVPGAACAAVAFAQDNILGGQHPGAQRAAEAVASGWVSSGHTLSRSARTTYANAG
jgi:hypothetical protein